MQKRHLLSCRSLWPRRAAGARHRRAVPASGLALAGECPADKRVADGQGQKPGPTMPVGVTDVVRASTDLSKEPLALQGRLFRLRQLDMKPGASCPGTATTSAPR